MGMYCIALALGDLGSLFGDYLKQISHCCHYLCVTDAEVVLPSGYKFCTGHYIFGGIKLSDYIIYS